MAISEGSLQWWDREFDDLGNPIRTDVREAAREIWPSCSRRASAILGDASDAPELMEAAVSCISRHLDRSGTRPPAPNGKRLLGLHFSQLLHRRAGKLGRIQFVGTSADLDDVAPTLDRDWLDRVNRWLDFEKLCPLLNKGNFTMFAMRWVGHPWQEISEKTGVPSQKARAAFWRAIGKARSIIEGNRYPKRK